MPDYHFVQHFLRPGNYVQTEFTCTAPEGAKCRTNCWTCYEEQREVCECISFNEDGHEREPDMRDFGYCLEMVWLTESDALEEMYNGERTPVRGPDPQPIQLEWTGDDYAWDYTS